jgi:predicted oxidoreductase
VKFDVIVVSAGLAGLVETAELAVARYPHSSGTTVLGGCLFTGRQAGRALAKEID